MDWPLQDAKNRFSELVQRARKEGPQVVTLRGARAAVVLSAETFDQLTANRPSLVDHLLSGPAWSDDVVGKNPSARQDRWSAKRILMYLIDTNVVSEARRRTPPAVAWLRSAPSSAIYHSSVLTLRRNPPRRPYSPKRAVGPTSRGKRLARMAAETAPAFRIDQFCQSADQIAAGMGADSGAAVARRRGFLVTTATAIVHGLILVTRNVTKVSKIRAFRS